jgi:hypothetical protein
MEQLKGSQIEFLQKYYQLLDSMSEGFDYLVQIPDLSSSDMANTLFSDLVKAFQQINDSHQQLVPLLKLDTVEEFQNIVQQMTKWFNPEQNKEELLTAEVVPAFTAWKNKMVKILKPYVLH